MELLVVVVIIGILTALILPVVSSMRDKADTVTCTSNLRSIVAGTLAWTIDRDGMLWSRREIGYSRYRMVDDPLGPPTLLQKYIPKKLWLCPSGYPVVVKFGNNYTWTVASQFDTTPVPLIENPAQTLLYWDAYAYSLPSLYNGVESSSSSWPSALPAKYQIKPHSKKALANWAYLDGHAETK